MPTTLFSRHAERICSRKGFVLVLVLMVTMLLAVLMLDLHESALLNLRIAENRAAAQQNLYACKSAIALATVTLLRDTEETDCDHLAETWAEPRMQAFNAVRKKWDPQGKLRSAQSVRLLGDEA